MNELLVAWTMWINNNYDVLIMTITLLIVGELMLEVIKLNKKIEEEASFSTKNMMKLAVLESKLKEITSKRKAVRK